LAVANFRFQSAPISAPVWYVLRLSVEEQAQRIVALGRTRAPTSASRPIPGQPSVMSDGHYLDMSRLLLKHDD
jgi:hypothetical protein